MTKEQREQALNDLRYIKEIVLDYSVEKSIDVAIEALEQQEPCTDAISRQDAIDTIEGWLSCDDYNETERYIMRAMQSVLYDLSSVTPQPKMGQWINLEKTKYKGQVLPFWGRYECSECGNHGQGDFYYCPSCGRKMEVEE